MNETTIIDQATKELPGALAALEAGDAEIARYARAVRQLLDHVTSQSLVALSKANQLRADDVMNPEGKRRLLTEIPSNLMATTSEQLETAETNLVVIEGIHLAAILKHDSKDDANLRAELGNYVATLKQENAVATMVSLAANPRYATFLSGPMGDSLAARFGFKPEILRETALKALAVDGSPEQVARSRALAGLPAARRALGLARSGRDLAVEQVKRPLAPNPSEALR